MHAHLSWAIQCALELLGLEAPGAASLGHSRGHIDFAAWCGLWLQWVRVVQAPGAVALGMQMHTPPKTVSVL